MSSLLIHLTGGRIETHFHIFGSLAFLSFYRDWRVLVPATVIVALDHMLRGIFYPQSVFGVLTQENWRWLEHAGWVVFEDIFLVISCLRGQNEMREIAENRAKRHISEARYRLVNNSASDAIITFDKTMTILFVNQSATKIFGYSESELLGKTLQKLIAPKAYRLYEIGMKRFLQADKRNLPQQAIEVPAIHKDEHEFIIEISFGGFESDGGRLFTAVMRDITERKKQEEALRKSEEYRNLFTHANDAIIIVDPQDETIINVNDFACKTYGYTREEFIGLKIDNIAQPVDDKNELIGKIMRGESLELLEVVHFQKDGTLINVSINSSLIEIDGKPAILSIIRDVTSSVEANLALRESEYKLRTLIENMSEGLLHLDRKNKIVYTNDRFRRMTGYTDDDLIGKNILCLLPEKEGKEIIEKIIRHQNKGLAENYELKVNTASGSGLWVLVGTVPTINANGKYVGTMSVLTDITERKHAEEKLLHNAMHDSLTGLPNRALFLEHLRRVMGRSTRRRKTFAVLFLDFDGFKLINDSLGHQEGDTLLKLIAKRLESLLRETDVVARLGGDEFTILLDELSHAKDAFYIADRISEVWKEPFRLGEREIYIGASIGIALRDNRYKTPEEMLRDADIAMYRAKAGGKGRYAVFNQEMYNQLTDRLSLESELRLALERGEFRVFYQPIVEIADNRLIGFEALVRWFHPQRGQILPGEFIPVAEETGLIVPMGEWVLREGCQQVYRWQQEFPEHQNLTLSVNLSCKQFLQQDLAERVSLVLSETNLNARFLRLEITESHVMENSEMAITIMNRLRNIGVQLSIDDFGTGYSSLSYLQRLPINYLKIDRSFINMMNSNHQNSEIVRAIVMLAKNTL